MAVLPVSSRARDFSVVDWTFEHPEGLPLEAAPTPPGAQAAAHARCEGRVDVRFHSPRVAAGREIAGSDGGVGLAASSPPAGPPGGRPSVRRAAPRRRLPSPPPRPRQQPAQPVPSQPRWARRGPLPHAPPSRPVPRTAGGAERLLAPLFAACLFSPVKRLFWIVVRFLSGRMSYY